MKLRAAFKSPTSNGFHTPPTPPPPSDPAPFCSGDGSIPLHPLSCQREPWEKRESQRAGGVQWEVQEKGGMRHQRDQQHMFRDILKVAYKRPAAQEVAVASLKLSAELHFKSTFSLSPPNYKCVKMTKLGVGGKSLGRVFTYCTDQE